MPSEAAAGLASDIVAITGPGSVPELRDFNPDASRRGPQTLPHINATRTARCIRVEVRVAGCFVGNGTTTIYVDNEEPRGEHVEMKGPEVHLGVTLRSPEGALNLASVQNADSWTPTKNRPSFNRIDGVVDRPAPSTSCDVRISFNQGEGAIFAACLLKASQGGY